MPSHHPEFDAHSDIDDEETSDKSILGRGIFYIRHTIHTLLTTPEALPEIAINTANQVFHSDLWVKAYGIFNRSTYVVVVLFFFISNFNAYHETTKFISLDRNAGKCDNVSKTFTIPILYADYYGHWSGSQEWQPLHSSYTFTLFNFRATDDYYKQWISEFDKVLMEIGEKSSTLDLSRNLIYWHAWSYTVPIKVETSKINGQYKLYDQQMILAADANNIMDNDVTQGTISDVVGDCAFAVTTEWYDNSKAALVMNFPSVSAAIADVNCHSFNAYLPQAMGWDPSISGDTLQIKLDVRSLFTALAVSYRVNGRDTLGRYTKMYELTSGTFRGTLFSVVNIYDRNYPMMSPVTCLGPKDSDYDSWNCFLKVGKSYGIPFLKHAGINMTRPVPCDCATAVGQNPACDVLDLMAGVIVYDISSNVSVISKYPKEFQPFIPLLEVFYVPPPFSAADCGDLAYYPAFTALYGQNNSFFEDPTWRKEKYFFSNTVSFGTGIFLTFQSSSYFDLTISPLKYQLRNGACNDAIYSPHFKFFYNNPWASLNEDYYQCTMDFFDAFFNAAGLGLAIADLFCPPMVILMIFSVLSIYSIRYHSVDDDKNGSRGSAAAAVHPLTNHVRDDRAKIYPGIVDDVEERFHSSESHIDSGFATYLGRNRGESYRVGELQPGIHSDENYVVKGFA